MDEKRIRVIPATNSRRLLVDDDSPVITRKKRVAAYARVSTGREEQQTSFKSQLEYYTRLILSNPRLGDGWRICRRRHLGTKYEKKGEVP